jgi:hypothetical protein
MVKFGGSDVAESMKLGMFLCVNVSTTRLFVCTQHVCRAHTQIGQTSRPAHSTKLARHPEISDPSPPLNPFWLGGSFFRGGGWSKEFHVYLTESLIMFNFSLRG